MAARKPKVVRQTKKKTKVVVDEPQEEKIQDVGLFGSIKGKIVSEGMDHLHPEDLARFELFRVKRELSVAKKTILQKEEQVMLLALRNKQQELEIKKLEYQVKQQQIVQLNDSATDEINLATRDLERFRNELAKEYGLELESLIYDDISGKLSVID